MQAFYRRKPAGLQDSGGLGYLRLPQLHACHPPRSQRDLLLGSRDLSIRVITAAEIALPESSENIRQQHEDKLAGMVIYLSMSAVRVKRVRYGAGGAECRSMAET